MNFKDKLLNKLKPTKSFQVVDFRSVKKVLPSLKVVDFRSKKKGLNESHDADDLHYELSDHHNHDDNEEHSKNINEYTRNSYSLNEQLHKSKGKDHKYYEKHIKHLDEATSKHKLHKDIVVHSGLHHEPKPGTYEHHGYMSSSLSSSMARNFAVKHDKGQGNRKEKHVLSLHLKKGSNHGTYIAHHSDHVDEREFLVGRGKKIKIHPKPEVSYHKDVAVHHWKGEIVD